MDKDEALIAIVVLGVAVALWLIGCRPKGGLVRSECHVVTMTAVIEPVQEDDPHSTRETWLTWCGEGKYVIFGSSAPAGAVLRYTEYQENEELQTRGYVTK